MDNEKITTLIDKLTKGSDESKLTELRKIVDATRLSLNVRKPVWDRHRAKYRRGLNYLRGFSSTVPVYYTNYIFANIESLKANLTRFLPKLSAAPRGLKDDIAAEYMTYVLHDELDRLKFKQAVKQVVHHGAIATFAAFKTYFDGENNVVECIKPDLMLIDPNASHPDDVRWIGNVRYDVSVDEIYAEFGKVPVRAHTRDLDEEPDDNDDFTSMDESRGTYTQHGDSKSALAVTDNFDVYELWVKDFVSNNWFVFAWAADTILKTEQNQYNHKGHPYDIWFDCEDDSADNCYYRGVGEIEEIEPLQDRADSLDIKIYTHISLMTNRQKYVSKSTGLSNVDNTAGRVYYVSGDPTKAVHYDAPPQMANEVYQYRDVTDMLIQVVSGMVDVTQGRRPTGITAGRAMQTLKDAADARIEEKAESLALVINSVGSKLLQNILQFFDAERLIKATDGDKDITFMVVADYPPELAPEPMPMIDPETGLPMEDEAGGYVIDEEQEPQVTADITLQREQWKQQNNVGLVLSDVTYEWDVKASVDNALPSTRSERGQQAVEMFRLGLIDRKAALDSIEFPNRYKILQRLEGSVTGANAGDQDAEGNGMLQAMTAALSDVLGQIGLPSEQIQPLVDAVLQATQQAAGGQASTQQQQSGMYNAQLTM